MSPSPGEGTYLTLDPDTGAVRQTRFSKGNPETYLLAGESIRGHAWETDLPGNVRSFLMTRENFLGSHGMNRGSVWKSVLLLYLKIDLASRPVILVCVAHPTQHGVMLS